MDRNQEYLAHGSGEIHEPDPHEEGCLCTSCTTERQLDQGGRYDHHIETFLHHIRDLRELRTPRSAGGAGYKRAEVAGVAEERTVGPSPTVDLKGVA
jgi:hypothetical protein